MHQAGFQASQDDSEFLSKNGSLLPAIAVPTVNASLDSKVWKQTSGTAIPGTVIIMTRVLLGTASMYPQNVY